MRIVKDEIQSGVVFEPEVESSGIENPLPTGLNLHTTTGEQVVGYKVVDTKYTLTPEIRAELKALYGSKAKKVSLLGQDFVFKIISREQWEMEVDDYIAQTEKKNKKAFTDEERDRRLLEVALVFPGLTSYERQGEFSFSAEQMTFFNSLPAGVQPRLARYVEHYSGFFVAELIEDQDELFAEDISDPYPAVPRPPQEEIDAVKNMTDLPTRLIRACGEWFAIRALRWSELKTYRQKTGDASDPDADVKILQKTILIGPKDFDNQPAGLVPYLFQHLRNLSGLDTEDPDAFVTEAEDL